MEVQQTEVHISVDVETAGPNPGTYAMLSIGACVVLKPDRTFYRELQPDRMAAEAEALSIHGLSLDRLALSGSPQREALQDFADWIRQQVPAGGTPVFVAFNAAFDWMFINDYFHRYLGYNPFGHNALDIKAYYMGMRRILTFRGLTARMLEEFHPARPLTHNALEDAIDQAQLFRAMVQAIAAGPLA